MDNETQATASEVRTKLQLLRADTSTTKNHPLLTAFSAWDKFSAQEEKIIQSLDKADSATLASLKKESFNSIEAAMKANKALTKQESEYSESPFT